MANTLQRFLAWCLLLKIISQQYSEMWKVLLLEKGVLAHTGKG